MINSSEKAAAAEESKDGDQSNWPVIVKEDAIAQAAESRMLAPPPRGTPMDVNKANEDIRRSA